MLIKIKARPGSGQQKIEQKEGHLEISLKNPAEQNKANIELINLVAKYFNKPVSAIKIIRGKTSKNKLIEVK